MHHVNLRSTFLAALTLLLLGGCARCDDPPPEENNPPGDRGDMSGASDMQVESDMSDDEEMNPAADMADDEDMGGDDPDQSASYALEIISPTTGDSVMPGALSVSVTIEPSPPEGAEIVLVLDELEVGRESELMGNASVTLAKRDVSHLTAAMPRQLTTRLMQGSELLAESEPVAITLSERRVTTDELFDRSEGTPRIEWQGGQPSLIRANVAIDAPDAVSRAYAFLREYDALLDLPGDLEENYYIKEVTRERRMSPMGDPEPLEVVQFKQRAHEIPVYLTDVTTVMRGDKVLFMSGQWLKELPAMPSEYRGMAEARQIVKDSFATIERTLPPKQFFYDKSLDWDPAQGARGASNPRLAWRVPAKGKPAPGDVHGLYHVWVDAVSGQILEIQTTRDDLSVLEDDPDVQVINYNNGTLEDCPLEDDGYWFAEGGSTECTEGGCDADAAPESVLLQNHSMLIYDWVLFTFYWYSFDNRNQRIRSYSLVETDDGVAAFYSRGCELMAFAPGQEIALVFGHEYMHSIAHHTINMERSQAATVTNETIADLFGAMYTGHQTNHMYSCHGRFDQANDGPVPGVFDPSCTPDPDDRATFFADHVSEYSTSRSPYYNGGIGLRAFGLAMRGGVHLDTNIAVTDPVDVPFDSVQAFYDMVALRMIPSNASLTRFLTLWREYIMTRPHGIDLGDMCAHINGVAAVGVGVGDIDCDGLLDDIDDDIDGDFIPNDQDNCPEVRNSHQFDRDEDSFGDECDPDEDGDGVPNSGDNCDEFNPTQTDSDMDGVGDACQDEDGDGFPESRDNCPELATDQAGNEDVDGDGSGNACDDDDDNDGVRDEDDNCPLAANQPQTDADGDGVGDVCDNCRIDANPMQTNTDGDAAGNVCDTDDDNDGFRDEDDNCPLDANPEQYDTDDNGIGLACDDGEKGLFWEVHFGRPATIAIEIVEALGGYTLPLPTCERDCVGWLAPGTVWVIEMSAQVPFAALLYNSAGEMIAVGEPGANGVTQIVFEPDHEFYSLANAQNAFVNEGYRIQFIPNPALHTYGDTFTMTMAVNSSQDPIGYDEVCGDMSVGGAEACDGGDLAGESCMSQGFTAGTLSCSTACEFDTSACTTCSNNTREPGEVCDGTDVNGQTCQDLGYPGGTLTCNASCSAIDTVGCRMCDPFSTTDCTQDMPCRSDGTCGLCADNSECTSPFVCYNNKCQLF